jgi:predicted AAA+ superfamily ATPase
VWETGAALEDKDLLDAAHALAPVMTLITQCGGGKTHTLAALYHLATKGSKAAEYSGVADLIS